MLAAWSSSDLMMSSIGASFTASGGTSSSISVSDDATAAGAANHPVALCAQVEGLAGRAGVPLDAYWDLMETTLENVRRCHTHV
jgi:hypothetical protein